MINKKIGHFAPHLLASLFFLFFPMLTHSLNETDQTAFLRAAKCGNVACLKKLLDAGMDINYQDKRGYSALLHTLLSQDYQTNNAVSLLLKQGADPLLAAHDGTPPLQLAFNSGHLEAASIIFNTIVQSPNLVVDTLKPSLSIVISDLKLDADGHITILELGEGPLSYFKGHDALYPKGLIWERFWQYLAAKNLPISYIGNLVTAGKEAQDIALTTLKEHGGVLYTSLHILEKDAAFKRIIASARAQNQRQAGFVILRHHSTNQAMLNYFKTTYPEITVIDEVVRPFVNSKFMTNLLFAQDPELQKFRPQCKTYPKSNAPAVIAAIQADFARHKHVVIKPLDSANGWGVIITPLRRIGEELKKIFDDREFLEGSIDPSYNYWLTDTNQHFIVENFVASKPITVNNKKYDGTMRQVFIIESGSTGIQTSFLGSYWKLPALGINDEGSQTERHKSNVKASKKPSAPVDAADDTIVRDTLRIILPRIYMKMLQCL